jgi:hypothetical protein
LPGYGGAIPRKEDIVSSWKQETGRDTKTPEWLLTEKLVYIETAEIGD